MLTGKDRRKKEHTENAVRPASRRSAAVVSLCLVFSLLYRPVPVQASSVEPPDITDDKKHSISVMMVYDKKTVEGGSFEAYRVGEIVGLKTPSKASGTSSPQDEGTAGGTAYRFWPTEALMEAVGLTQEEIDQIDTIDKEKPGAESEMNAILSPKLKGLELNGIETAAQKEALARELAAYVNPAADPEGGSEEESGGSVGYSGAADPWGDGHMTGANVDGIAEFDDLPTGLYLFTQSAEQASPGYYPVEPFLVSVPVYDKEYNYAVEAFPNDHEVKIYVKFRLMAIPSDPPDPPGPDPKPDPDPDPPGPDPKPDPDPPGSDPEPDPGPAPAPDPEPEPQIEQWFREYLAQPPEAKEAEVAPKLPQTGQINWPVPALAVGGAVMFFAGMILRQHGKKSAAGKE